MKILLFSVFLTLLVILQDCRPKPDCRKLYNYFESEFANGNFMIANKTADSLKKWCTGDSDLIRKTDSLVQVAERISLDFSLTGEQFLKKVEEFNERVTDSMLNIWNKNNWIEWRIIDGEKRYFNRAASNLKLLKLFYEEKERQLLEISSDPEMIDRLRHTLQVVNESDKRTDPVSPVKMLITYTIIVPPDVVPEGETIRCWIPLPSNKHPRQQDFKLLEVSNEDYIISPDTAIHKSIYIEEKSTKGKPALFRVSYRYQSSAQYFDLDTLNILPYDKTSSLYKRYTSEEPPQIHFSENIRRLADSITNPGDDPRSIVKKIFLWFKGNIPWTGALEYSTMPDIPDYVYNNRRGDCGMQTFMFMSMLRYKGIPVRWQSGWKVPPGFKNLHDWSEVYYEGPGWVPADISYDLQNSEDKVIKEFFLSGIDSYRLIVNNGISGPLYPAKQHLRSEPYDFQRGEVEWKGGNLYFDKWDYKMDIEYIRDPVSYVDPLIGTAPATTVSAARHSAGSEQKGQTFPAVGQPFGMTQWTPETRTTELKCISPYYFDDKNITGFRGSHWMSGSCTQDYGTFTVMPFVADRPDKVTQEPVSAYNHSSESSSPFYYSVLLNDSGILSELTGSVRSGIMRFTFPGTDGNCIFIRANSDEKQGKIWYDEKKNEIAGYNPVHRIYQGRGESAGFSGCFVFRFNRQFKIIQNKINSQGILLSFGNEKNIMIRIGTSFTSLESARNNLDKEIPDWNFEDVMNESKRVWNKTLGKVTVRGGSEDDRIKFYSGLYHCYLLPRIASDCDGSYQGFAEDTLIHKAEGFDYYDDFSMWDTYRGLHPLMTILEPDKTLEMVKSLVLKAEQGGWMPIFPMWASYSAAMIGDHVNTMISDAYVKGINDFDIETSYTYMRQNAFESPDLKQYVDGKGRRALQSYLEYGYIPLEDSVWDAFHRREQVSRTLEYAFDDYALAQTAKVLGKKKDYRILMNRSKNYRNVYDPGTGYVRGRYADGTWIEPFDPNVKASFICEGTPFQYTWYVPHDVPGLIKLMGGRESFLKKLNEFFDGGYYWHGNETDQQAPFMFTMAGDPAGTQQRTLEINSEEYGTGPGGLSGNEDCGQMSAWLVFSMMGFYPVCPGSGQYVITTPAFDEISIELAGGKHFTSKTLNRNDENIFIRSASLNGKKFKRYYLTHKEITQGGEVVFNLSE